MLAVSEIKFQPGIALTKTDPSSRVTPTIMLLLLNFPARRSLAGESVIEYTKQLKNMRGTHNSLYPYLIII